MRSRRSEATISAPHELPAMLSSDHLLAVENPPVIIVLDRLTIICLIF